MKRSAGARGLPSGGGFWPPTDIKQRIRISEIISYYSKIVSLRKSGRRGRKERVYFK
jgi:hypothetical protein